MSLSDRLLLEKELEELVDGMPTHALQILVEYAKKVREVYAAKEGNERRQG